MAERVTRLDVNRAFALAFPLERCTEKAGATDNAHNIGKYFLDYATCYGGYRVEVYAGGDSGAGWCHGTPPWGHTERRSSREMVAWLRGVAAGRNMQPSPMAGAGALEGDQTMEA